VLKSKTLAFAAGGIRPDELNDQFETNLPENESDTLNGLLFERLGRPAIKGEEILIDTVKFKVLEVDGHRIQRLRIEKIPTKKS
jgi:CBS domain containing-hemolysin-like protein